MNFFLMGDHDGGILAHAYSSWLVMLSLLVAMSGSAVALYIASAISSSGSVYARRVLMWVGAFAFGTAVWSMHFIGMLAFELCTSVRYDSV